MRLTTDGRGRRVARPLSDRQQRFVALSQVLKLTGIGWLVVLVIGAPTLLGVWLDGLLGTGYIVIIGFLAGLALAPISVWRVVKILYPKANDA